MIMMMILVVVSGEGRMRWAFLDLLEGVLCMQWEGGAGGLRNEHQQHLQNGSNVLYGV